MRYIRVLWLIILIPLYLPAKGLIYVHRYAHAYYDYRRFIHRYKGKVIPLSGQQIHRWQILNKGTHPLYRPIWLAMCRAMRNNPEQLQGYYLSRVLMEYGQPGEHTQDLLTPDNFYTFDFRKKENAL